MRSRGAAAVLAAAVHIILLYVFAAGLGWLPTPQAVMEQQPMQVFLFGAPRTTHSAAKFAPVKVRTAMRLIDWAEVPLPEISLPAEPTPPQETNTSTLVASSAREHGNSAPGDSNGLTAIHRVEPVYPVESRQAHEEGTTTINVLIDAQGHPKKLNVARSSGHSRLDRAAEQAISQMTFAPSDSAQDEWAEVQVGFHLHSLGHTLRVSGIHLALMPFDEQVAGEFKAVTPKVAGALPWPSTAQRLRGLIERLCDLPATGDSRTQQGLKSPLQLLAERGELKQVRFMGLARHALAIDDFPHAKQEVRWDLYKATQEHGTSNWLVGIDASGTIKSVQMMADR